MLAAAVAEDDLVVVSAGSSVGARDLTAAVAAQLGDVVCHGLGVKPGKPTLLADCGGVPLVGLPGNPRSALVVFRLVGMPLVRTVAGITAPPAAATVRAELARDVPSAAGRLDIVQVALRDGVATPRFGSSALLGPMVRRRRLDPRARGGDRPRRGDGGRRRALRLSDALTVPRAAPFLSDIPAAEALAAWLAEVRRVEAVELDLADALGRVTAAPVWALRSSPAYDAAAMDGIAVRAADTVGATETAPRAVARYALVDTGDALPEGFDAVVMREHVHWEDDVPEVRAAVAPWQHVRTIGEDVSATELLLPEGHRLRPVDLAAAGAAGHTALTVRRAPHVVVIPTGDEVRPLGADPAPGELVDTNSLMLAAQARRRMHGRDARDRARRPGADRRRGARRRRARRPRDRDRGSSAGRDDHTAAVVARGRHGARPRRRGPARPSGRARPGGRHRRARRAGLSRLGRPDLRHLRRPAAGALEGAAPVDRPVRGRGWRGGSRRSLGADDWIRVRLGRVGGGLVATPLPRGAGVLTSLVRADGLLVVPAASRATTPARRSRSGCCATSTPSSARSSRSAPTTRCSTSPRRCCAPAIRCRRSSAARSARSAGSSRCATGCATSPAAICSTRRRVSTRCRGSSACCRARTVEVVRLVHREQGLIVAPGNPLGVGGLADLPRLRYVNRQRGAGTRVLLDHELGRAGHRRAPRSTATSARSRRTSRSPPRSPRAAPTPAWASWPRRSRSGSTSSPSRASRSTS